MTYQRSGFAFAELFFPFVRFLSGIASLTYNVLNLPEFYCYPIDDTSIEVSMADVITLDAILHKEDTKCQ